MSVHEADELSAEQLKKQETAVADDFGQYADADAQRMQRLIEFLDTNGVTYPSLEIKIVNGLRGVYSTEKIVEGEVVLHVPRRMIVTTEVAKSSAIGKAILKSRRWLSPYGYMAAFLLETKKNGGFWKPYFDVVPSKFPGMPVFYDHRHLDLLRGTHVWEQLVASKAMQFDDYKVVKDFMPGLTLHDFSLARMAVTTRVYKLIVDGYETLGMVPLADMLNHTSPSPTHWTGRATNGFTIMALQDLPAGGEILESYGKRSNGRWLMSHGLCMEVNPENLAEVELPEIRRAHPFCYQLAEIGEKRRKRRVFTVLQNYDSDEARHMFTYLRLSCNTDVKTSSSMLVRLDEKKREMEQKKEKELEERKKDPEKKKLPPAGAKGEAEKPQFDKKKLPPVSVKNELAALAALAAACERGFERYMTTLEEDEETLKDPDLVWTVRFATMAALSEKRILKYYRDLAHTAMAALRSSPFQLARTVADEVREGRPYAAYFKDLQAHLEEFSPFWHVSRLPVRKHRSTVRKNDHAKKPAHTACA